MRDTVVLVSPKLRRGRDARLGVSDRPAMTGVRIIRGAAAGSPACADGGVRGVADAAQPARMNSNTTGPTCRRRLRHPSPPPWRGRVREGATLTTLSPEQTLSRQLHHTRH